LLYTVKEKGRKSDWKPYPLPYGLRNSYWNLKAGELSRLSKLMNQYGGGGPGFFAIYILYKSMTILLQVSLLAAIIAKLNMVTTARCGRGGGRKRVQSFSHGGFSKISNFQSLKGKGKSSFTAAFFHNLMHKE
jgi:hypothetical protein